MNDLISRSALYQELSKEGSHCIELGTKTGISWATAIEQAKLILKNAPAVDAVEVEYLEAWLYEVALNNVGQPVEDMAAACEDIISRLEGLRRFASERRNGDANG